MYFIFDPEFIATKFAPLNYSKILHGILIISLYLYYLVKPRSTSSSIIPLICQTLYN